MAWFGPTHPLWPLRISVTHLCSSLLLLLLLLNGSALVLLYCHLRAQRGGGGFMLARLPALGMLQHTMRCEANAGEVLVDNLTKALSASATMQAASFRVALCICHAHLLLFCSVSLDGSLAPGC